MIDRHKNWPLKLVPFEPTEKMLKAGNPAGIKFDEWRKESFNEDWARAIYKAMLLAAPEIYVDQKGNPYEL